MPRRPRQQLKTKTRRTALRNPLSRIRRRALPTLHPQPNRAQTPATRIRDRRTRAPQAATTAHPQAAQAPAKLPAIIRIQIPTTQTALALALAQRIRAEMPQIQGHRGRNRAHRRKRGRASNPRRNISLGKKSREAATRAQVKNEFSSTGNSKKAHAYIQKRACIVLQARRRSGQLCLPFGSSPCAFVSRRSSNFRPYRFS